MVGEEDEEALNARSGGDWAGGVRKTGALRGQSESAGGV
jgi:hypothetical protein